MNARNLYVMMACLTAVSDIFSMSGESIPLQKQERPVSSSNKPAGKQERVTLPSWINKTTVSGFAVALGMVAYKIFRAQEQNVIGAIQRSNPQIPPRQPTPQISLDQLLTREMVADELHRITSITLDNTTITQMYERYHRNPNLFLGLTTQQATRERVSYLLRQAISIAELLLNRNNVDGKNPPLPPDATPEIK